MHTEKEEFVKTHPGPKKFKFDFLHVEFFAKKNYYNDGLKIV